MRGAGKGEASFPTITTVAQTEDFLHSWLRALSIQTRVRLPCMPPRDSEWTGDSRDVWPVCLCAGVLKGQAFPVFTGDSILFCTLGCQTDGHRKDLPPPHLTQWRAKVTFLMLPMLKKLLRYIMHEKGIFNSHLRVSKGFPGWRDDLVIKS